MGKFIYLAKDENSRTRKGTIDAGSRDEAVKILQAQGLYIISLGSSDKLTKEVIRPDERKFAHSRIALGDLALFARQLATLLSSGVPLLRSLETLSAQCASKKLYVVLCKITEDIKGGLSLTESIGKYPNVFASLWRGLIDTGEASGNLAGVLEKLADYLEMRQEFLRRITSALLYPLILLIAGFSAILAFSFLILPRFREIFDQFGAELPLPTQLLFGSVDLATKNFWIILIALAGSIFIVRSFVKTQTGRSIVDNIKLSAPLLKDFFQTYFLERFSSTAFILFESGVPIVYTLEVIQRSIGNTIFEHHLAEIKENVKGGKPLSSELARFNLFPPMLIEMTLVGEEVGNFPEIFSKVSKHFQTALQTKVERFTSLFEPAMIIVMGAAVGAIVISLFLPLFQLASAVH